MHAFIGEMLEREGERVFEGERERTERDKWRKYACVLKQRERMRKRN